ncbi:MAG: hypothetical protein HY509_02665, partial [Acidobacteria bacterium]|nr:hypothetical protein [Acidobacteriota bacterium]
PPGARGRTLRPLWAGSAARAVPPVFAEEHFEDRFSRVAVRAGGWKLIRVTDRSAGRTGSPSVRQELYDLAGDPAEATDLIRLRPGIAHELGEILDRHLEGMGEAPPGEPVEIPFDPDAERRLRALGYLE